MLAFLISRTNKNSAIMFHPVENLTKLTEVILFSVGRRWNPWICSNLCKQLQLNDYRLHHLPGHTHRMRKLEGMNSGKTHECFNTSAVR